jgi:hypothetical protein
MLGSQASAQTRVLLRSDQKGKDDRWGLPVSSKKEGEDELGQPIGQQTDSLRLLLGRAKEDSRMGWKHKQKENELDVQ